MSDRPETALDPRKFARRGLSWALLPFHFAAVFGKAKSFRNNPVLGAHSLNTAGLHLARVRSAEKFARRRRQHLSRYISDSDAADFDRQGFIIKEPFLPKPDFIRLRDEIFRLKLPARAMLQGDAITRRIALDGKACDQGPAIRELLSNPMWLGLIRYAGASKLIPITYVQTIFSKVCTGVRDPQLRLHADTFHATVKAWLFLEDVRSSMGPFTYVPGSHQLTPEKIRWLYRMSLTALSSPDGETQDGSFRLDESDLAEMGLPSPRQFVVPANTLIVADTSGFHCRGESEEPSVRTEVWAYGRRNPFLPWTGFDPAGLPILRDNAVRLSWAMADFTEQLGMSRNPWRQEGSLHAQDPFDVRMFDGSSAAGFERPGCGNMTAV